MTNARVIAAARKTAGWISAVAIVAIASVGVAAPAQAASDANVEATITTSRLSMDADGNGRPDVGDKVIYTLIVASTAQGGISEFSIPSFLIGGIDYALYSQRQLPYVVDVEVTVRAEDLDGVGRGPFIDPPVLVYALGWVSQPPLLLESPAPLNTAVLTAQTALELEGSSAAPTGGLVEGDRVRHTATVTNTAAVQVTLTSAVGLDSSPSLPTALAAGATTTLNGAWHTVTFADMRAGSVQFAATSVDWAAESLSGSAPVAAVSAMTAVPVVSYTTHFDTVIHSPGYGVERGFGDAQVGDLLDRTYVATNTGNVALNYFVMTNSNSGYYFYDVGLKPGESIPESGLSTGNDLAKVTSLPGGYFESDRRTLTAADLQRGYVDVSGGMGVFPSYNEQAWGSQGAVTTRVLLRELTADVDWSVDAELQDTNGDGVGQAGEDVELTWTAALPADADQSVTIGSVSESGQFGAVGTAFDGVVLTPGESSTHTDIVAIDAAWLATGALDYTATLSYSGDIDAAVSSAVASADAVVLGEYVAPSVSLGAASSFDDLNGDGQASLGEKVTFDVTVVNDGAYPLTGVTLGETGGATLPADAVAVSDLAPGASAAWTATHVVTAADFAAGSVSYSPSVDADGMSRLTETATVAPLTFAAYESDLDGIVEGGVAVCSAAGEAVASAVQGSSVSVVLDECGGAPLVDGSRIVAFSAPMLLGVGAAAVEIPATLAVGAHRIAVYGADGVLVGWATIAITKPVVVVEPAEDAAGVATAEPVEVAAPVASYSEAAEQLSTTGSQGIGPMLWLATALTLAGAGGVFVARRRGSRVDV
ncbi:DUF7507 domain-containing protein [Demequina aurantiaca]|uniref:DUF7507 domain-containing protein n=1 Tax=Demequina aurantiaca TaxID=676200 RepID=UPI003D33E765